MKDHSYGAWDGFPLQILLQWRWDNDREAVLREDAEKAARQAAERRIQEERRAEYLKTVTLQSLAGREWFGSWDAELDAAHIPRARQLVAKLVADLALIAKLTKPTARRLLKRAVTEFNTLDQADRFIETTHREDICEALELVMCAARFPDLVPEMDEWRDW